LKAAECLWALGCIVRQELKRDKTAELQILSLEYHSHCASPEFFNDVIVRDGLSDHWANLNSVKLVSQ
jgi:hypothetical protein